MKRVLVLALLAGHTAQAEPRFEDRSAALADHVYSGGWEHFVGGGIAVFDCNGDDRPDIYAAGGQAPAKLFINRGDFEFEVAPLVSLTDVVGAYPLDIDADGMQDLFVLRVGQNRLLKGDGACGLTDATQILGLPRSGRAAPAGWAVPRRMNCLWNC